MSAQLTPFMLDLLLLHEESIKSLIYITHKDAFMLKHNKTIINSDINGEIATSTEVCIEY